jgi:hypothetical protein
MLLVLVVYFAQTRGGGSRAQASIKTDVLDHGTALIA